MFYLVNCSVLFTELPSPARPAPARSLSRWLTAPSTGPSTAGFDRLTTGS